ncbi:uncharacterized protein LOC107692211 [Sinocyclocheilus anshuiensis]|uniref:uncharacterized protein LOC107692211 n=1 Tax=Sinocyclocheilus anshuiensis TaxID=1608454 RepID=UPI0007B98A8B|nr:PREDICTED: uncharacterized protein LOC107692211 [Sinocyclocheilus anshuiensis]XP_016346661.1 PREDICTED: uncharacterized protein LOC107692211 [Sinocyclocheilus anshuiensis]
MAPKRLRCSVVGCKNEHGCRHLVPTSEPLKTQWISFVFEGDAPPDLPKCVYVCSNHFTQDCFVNEGQYKAGFATKLILRDGSVPTVRDPASPSAESSSSEEWAKVHHVACQTDTTQLCTVGTQLSIKTLRPHYKSTGTQTAMACPDIGVGSSQPLLSSTSKKRPNKRSRLKLVEEEEDPFGGSSSLITKEPIDSTYDPVNSVTALTKPTDVTMQSSKPAHKNATYIVYESCLLELFEQCPECYRVSDVRTRRVGTFLSVEQRCPDCDFSRKWNSQPILGSTAAGNLQLSVALYASGASFFKLKKIFRAMQLKMINYETFRKHARSYIEPAIVHSWKTAQDGMLQQLRQQQNIVLGGDLRVNLPGHSAKFGSYSVMDLRTSTIIDLQLLQSNEDGGSNYMEKEGLKRSLDVLRAHGVTFDSIVTDRHPQVQKFLRETNITQYYDVWHIEKGLSKKLLKISQSKECEKLRKWLRSIKNHIYWTAASSSSGQERVAKWTSILNHVQDIHTHEDLVFPRCLHWQRTSRDKSKWLRAGTPVFCRLEKVLTNKRILKDVEKLSPHHQTSSLEAFHSVIRRLAPKNVVFAFLGMLCRLYLAALHFNENAGRPQATTAAGEPLYKINLPKSKKGQCTAKPVKADSTFHYVDNLMDLIFEKVVMDPAPYVDEVLKISTPEDLASQFEKPDKLEVIASYVSRFNQGQV